MRCQSQSRPRRNRGRFLPVLVGLFFLSLGASSFADDNSLIGKPVIGRNADGHLEVFNADADGEVRHRWQKPSDGDWSAWSSLGGAFLPGIFVATDSDGLMNVFAVEQHSNALKFIRQKTTNGVEWLSWTNLGGPVRPPITVGQNADGRLEVFAVDANSGAVRCIWQTNVHGGWSSWSDLGGNVLPGLVTVANRDGRLEIFGVESK